MATIEKDHKKPQCRDEAFGLLANGSSGAWQVDVDEALGGADRWWAQIEGPSVSLTFQIPSLDIIDKMIRFLGPPVAKTKRPANGAAKQGSSLDVGGTSPVAVTLVKDDEFEDRFFFFVGGAADQLMVRLAISGADVSEITEALRQVKEDLADDE